MIEVHDRLFVGTERDCFHKRDGWAVVDVWKHPCLVNAAGYRGSLSNTHPNYLSLESGPNLYLNIVDPPKPLFFPKTFVDFMIFARKHYSEGKNLLIHCNQGESRAPSLALLFKSKGLHVISDRNFVEKYRGYTPGRGINRYFPYR